MEIMEETDEGEQIISQEPVRNRMEDQIVDVLFSSLSGGNRVRTIAARAELRGEAERGRTASPVLGNC